MCPVCNSRIPEESGGVCPVCLLRAAGGADETRAEPPIVAVGPVAQGMYGPYRPVGVLGEGGMGIVYLAEQLEPVRRRVALKVMKQAATAGPLMARFESERQALALLDHHHIAKLYDAGETTDGRPWFAMEYVAGIPITDYCDTSQLGCRDRLLLFQQVCRAVEHANQQGIIHRDLKPSNILVTKSDGVATPKVIDFGVAKAMNAPLTERTLFTEMGMLIGTPEYMSPEQAGGMLEVDGATDIYALGVLLYELLVGATPFDSKLLRRAGYNEICRIIRETDPPRPGARLHSLGETASEVARRRGGSVAALLRAVHGDLEWITMKALEKEPVRRYGSAGDFAADVERHLRDEPVIARAPSAGYRVRKFMRRRRLEVIAAGAVVLAVGLGLVALKRNRPYAPTEMTQHKIELPGAHFVASDTDGRHVVYRNDETGELMYGDMGGKTKRVIFKGKPDDLTSWMPSRDFSMVALHFDAKPGRPGFLALIKTNGTGYHELLRDNGSETFVMHNWSWDSRWLLIHRQDATLRHLLLVSIDTGEPRELVAWKAGNWIGGAAVSPDGRIVAYQDLTESNGQSTARILVVPIKGGARQVVYEEPITGSGTSLKFLDWMPDARYLAVSSSRTGRAALYLVPVRDGQPDGAPVFVRYGRFETAYATKSGSLIYQTPQPGGLWRLHVASLDSTGRPGHWQEFDGVSQNNTNPWPRWSPAGDKIVYIARDPDVGSSGNAVVRVHNLSTHQDREVYRTAGHIVCAWETRESKILCSQWVKGSEILSISPESGQTERIGAFPMPVLLDRASRDGRALYLDRFGYDGTQVFCRWDIAARRESPIIEYRGEKEIPFVISQDEHWLIGHDQPDIRLRPLAGGDWKSAAPVDTYQFSITPDGEWLFYYALDAAGQPGLFRVATTGGPTQHLGDFSQRSETGTLEISPTGRHIVAASRNLQNGLEVWSLENFIPAAGKQ